MKTNFDELNSDRLIDEPANYKWGVFYFNPQDKRVVVPKRSKYLGWTLNFASVYAYLLIIAVALILVFLT